MFTDPFTGGVRLGLSSASVARAREGRGGAVDAERERLIPVLERAARRVVLLGAVGALLAQVNLLGRVATSWSCVGHEAPEVHVDETEPM